MKKYTLIPLLLVFLCSLIACSHIAVGERPNVNEMIVDTVWGDYTVILPEGISDFYNDPGSIKTTKNYSSKIVVLQGTIPGKCAHQLWVERGNPLIYALVVLDCATNSVRHWIYPYAGKLHSGQPEEVNITEFYLFIETVDRLKKEV